MRRLVAPLILSSSLLLAVACAPASQPAPTAAPPKPTAAPAATTAPAPAAKPTEAPKPAAAASPAAAPAAAAKPTEAPKPAASPAAAPAPGKDAGRVIFFSNQFFPVEEQEKMRNIILRNAPGQVEYIAENPGPYNDRIVAEQRAGRVTVSLLGGLHGDFAAYLKDGYFEDLTPLMSRLSDRGFPPTFVELSRFGTPDKHYYVPWIQATYVLAVNKRALQYLPQGADVNALTYTQLKEWGANIQRATGQRRLGFPMGPSGLYHRFFQGYLYPSYTGSSGVVGFKSPEAVQMWQEFKEIWQYVNPQSTSYNNMQEPLLSDEVWVAWDHVARLVNAGRDRPDDFVFVPAPAGPKGRGFMPVLGGMAIPKGAPNRAGAEALIEYLTQPAQQVNTLRELAFFPVTNAPIPAELPPGIRLEADAVGKQAAARDALVSLLPIGLGGKGGEFNKVFQDSFQSIVLRNEPIQGVLEAQARILQGIMTETGAPCWAPDPPSNGPCQVK